MKNNVENEFLFGADNGQIKRDKFTFLDGVANSSVVDKDAAFECLGALPPLYQDVAGVSRRTGRKIIGRLENKLLGGTAQQQVEAAAVIFEAKSGLEQGRRIKNGTSTELF